MTQVPIYFCMPLIGRQAAKDWQKVCRLLEQTLESILPQPGNIKVLIACNEVPQTRFANDERVRFLQMESTPPKNITEMRRDTRSKRARVIDEVAASGGGYVVRVDADDLISNQLTRHIMRDDNRVGYVFKQGYTYNAATKEFRLSRSFNKLCGTCGVIFLGPDDLSQGSAPRKIAMSGHSGFEQRCRAIGRVLAEVPFPAALYLTNHGESVRDKLPSQSTVHWVKSHLRAVRGRFRKLFSRHHLTPELRAEFGLRQY
jgi:hypothetical protein